MSLWYTIEINFHGYKCIVRKDPLFLPFARNSTFIRLLRHSLCLTSKSNITQLSSENYSYSATTFLGGDLYLSWQPSTSSHHFQQYFSLLILVCKLVARYLISPLSAILFPSDMPLVYAKLSRTNTLLMIHLRNTLLRDRP